jgi:hypothetical protein
MFFAFLVEMAIIIVAIFVVPGSFYQLAMSKFAFLLLLPICSVKSSLAIRFVRLPHAFIANFSKVVIINPITAFLAI